MDEQPKQDSRAGDGSQQQQLDADGEKGMAIMRENVDGSELEHQTQNDSKKQGYINIEEGDLDFQIEDNSSDHRRPNHSSTAADNF